MRVLDVLLDVLKNHPITVLELLGLFSETPTVEQVYAQFEITTIHKAKGLEWDNVILIGLYDERFPSDKKGGIIEQSPNALKEALDGNLEEERRLFYVAITRVKKRLYLLHPEDDMFVKRVRDGWYSTPKKGNVATRFLYEMDYKGADAVNSYLNFQTDSKYPSEYKLGKKYIYGYKQLNGVTKQK
jgi:DNA helicase-2/ATP-dependent DNA helicase PcrA